MMNEEIQHFRRIPLAAMRKQMVESTYSIGTTCCPAAVPPVEEEGPTS